MTRVKPGEAGQARLTEAAEGGAPRSGTAGPRRAVFRQRPGWALIVPPAVTLAVTLWGITALPYWGDEADTVSAVSRSLPQFARLVGHVDAVHGLYYLLLWPVARVAGTGPLAARLPSVLAMAAAALGVGVIGRRLRTPCAGLCAGLVFAVLPVVSQQAHDARPYAMVMAAAVLASLQLIRAADDPRPSRFAAYGLSLVLLGYLELFALLIVPAHAVTMMAWGRGRTPPGPGGATRRASLADVLRSPVARRWLVSVTAAGLAVTPVVAGGWLQRGQIAWIKPPGWADVRYLVSWLAAGSAVSAALVVVLAVLARRQADAPARPGAQLTWLAVPWLVIPPVTLMGVSAVAPVYSFRYVIFCLPAVALLAGAGLTALGWVWRAAAFALIVALAVPAQQLLRVPGNGGGAGMLGAAQVLASRERPGDAVVYPGTDIPPWDLVYPRAFRPLRDLSLARSGAALGRLYSSSVPPPVLLRREGNVSRIWIVEANQPWPGPDGYLAPGFRLVHTWWPDHGAARLALYQRSPRARP